MRRRRAVQGLSKFPNDLNGVVSDYDKAILLDPNNKNGIPQ